MPKVKVAAVQAAPVYLDLSASVDKACSLVREAARNGAQLVVFPEAFLPGGPYWAWVQGMRESFDLFRELFENSVSIPSQEVEAIGAVARETGTWVVMGANERDNKTIYNSVLFFNDDGELIGKHRKLKPTGAEKLVWGDGDGSTFRVHDTPFGKLGALICGEHTVQLPGYALSAMGEQIHAACWIGFATADLSLTEVCSRFYAIANNAHVIAAQSVVGQDVIDRIKSPNLKTGNAWSAIIEAGSGRIIAGPLAPDEEGILYATLDTESIIPHYLFHESTGHYKPKEFTLLFDPTPRPALMVGREQETRVRL